MNSFVESYRKYFRRTSNKFLRKFKKKKSSSQVKKEYLRVMLMRGHKKSIRGILQNKLKIRALNGIVDCQLFLWDDYKAHCLAHRDTLENISLTRNGPAIDRNFNSFVSSNSDSCGSKTYKDLYCFQYFGNKTIRDSFVNYIQFLFGNRNIESLIERFDIVCCEKSHHEDQCHKKWADLKAFIIEDIARVHCFQKEENLQVENEFELAAEVDNMLAI